MELTEKECKTCKVIKHILEFHKNPAEKDGYRSSCAVCRKNTRKGNLSSFLIDVYRQQLSASKQRNVKPPDYSREEFLTKFINNETLINLHKLYVESNFDINIVPTFDRSDDYAAYSLDSLTVMTYEDNRNNYFKNQQSGVTNKRNVGVYKISIDTDEIINTYFSVAEAARQNNCQDSKICAVCVGKRKTHNGFKWRYIDEQVRTDSFTRLQRV